MGIEPNKILNNDLNNELDALNKALVRLDQDNDTQLLKSIFNDQESSDLESIMLSKINFQAMIFAVEAHDCEVFQPIGELANNIDSCLNIFITTGNIKPIQKLALQILKKINVDKLDRMFRAYINLRLSNLYLALNNYTEALKYYERGITYCNLKDFDDMKNDISTYINKERGIKGGLQKGANYSEPKQKALDYHDRYLGTKNKKGKFTYSNDKSAREIISYFERKSVHLGYTERSLSNIISKHRREQTKG